VRRQCGTRTQSRRGWKRRVTWPVFAYVFVGGAAAHLIAVGGPAFVPAGPSGSASVVTGHRRSTEHRWESVTKAINSGWLSRQTSVLLAQYAHSSAASYDAVDVESAEWGSTRAMHARSLDVMREIDRRSISSIAADGAWRAGTYREMVGAQIFATRTCLVVTVEGGLPFRHSWCQIVIVGSNGRRLDASGTRAIVLHEGDLNQLYSHDPLARVMPYGVRPIPAIGNAIVWGLTLACLRLTIGRVSCARRSRRGSRCGSCGYPTIGWTTICPECGATSNEPLSHERPVAPP